MIAATGVAATITVIVAAFTALTGVVTWFVNGVRDERTRLQKLYADAYSTVMSFKEYPYLVRHRLAPSAAHPELAGVERLRISDSLHEVQVALNTHRAQIRTESDDVSAKYEVLVDKTRKLVREYMERAWKQGPLESDAYMSERYDYDPLEQYQLEYLEAVKRDMTFWRVANLRRRRN